ncbi:MAG: hypothetical protein GW893_19220 [Armatimonadetes bacterium]|nr:hypothetical protein [Armatimonadota bacterium]
MKLKVKNWDKNDSGKSSGLVLLVVMLTIPGQTMWGIAAGVAADWQTRADAVAKTYVTLIQQNKFASAYELLSDSHRTSVTLTDYKGALGGSSSMLQGKIVKCSVLPVAVDRVTANVVLQSDNKVTPPHSIELHLIKSPSGKWRITYGDELLQFVNGFRAEQVTNTVQKYAEAWLNHDYDAMSALLDRECLKETYGAAPYANKLRVSCEKWESERARLDGISCSSSYVHHMRTGEATVPAKFCYTDPDKQRRFVPYLIRLRQNPSTRRWMITELRQTDTYERPPDVDRLVPPERLKAEAEAVSK